MLFRSRAETTEIRNGLEEPEQQREDPQHEEVDEPAAVNVRREEAGVENLASAVGAAEDDSEGSCPHVGLIWVMPHTARGGVCVCRSEEVE